MRRMAGSIGILLTLAAAAASIHGCDSGSPQSAIMDGGDGTGDASFIDGGSVDASASLPLDEPLSASQVRAGTVTKASELLGGYGARGAVGDVKIYNDRVAFVIQAVENPKCWGPYGGSLIDAARLTAGDTRGTDLFFELVQAFGMPPRAFKAASIEVIADGSDGAAAVVRVKGKDGGIHILDAALCPGSLCADFNLDVTTDYALEPASDRLAIETRIVPRKRRLESFALGDMFHPGDRTRAFAPGGGYEITTGAHIPWIAGLSPTVSYAYLRDTDEHLIEIPLIQDEIILVQGDAVDVPRGQEHVYRRHLHVGDGSAEGVWAAERKLRNADAQGSIAGVVTNGEGAQVIARPGTGAGPISQAWAGADGSFTLSLPAGSYSLTAEKKRVRTAAPVPVDVADRQSVSAALALDAPAILHVEIGTEDAVGLPQGPAPARVALLAGHDAPPAGGRAALLYVKAGPQDFSVEPGEYTAYVTRGFEFEYAKANVALVAGQTATLTTTIRHSVPTPGMVSADLHLHTTRSIDAQRSEDDHVAALSGEGVEVLASTDHDYIDDVQGVIDAQGYTPWVRALTGTEVSPVWAHMNAYPIPPGPLVGRYFTIPFIEHDADGNFARKIYFPEAFALARQAGAKVLQMNHVRTGAAYFNHIEYDPAIGVGPLDHQKWSPEFDAFEVWNGSEDVQFLRTRTFPDWWSFLNQGLVFTAVGNSDAHNSGGGIPRNLVSIGVDSAAEVTPDGFAEGILKHRSIVYGGPFIALRAGAGGIGDTVTATPVDLHIRVEAPIWIPVNFVELVRNGKIETTFDLEEAQRQGTIVFDETIPLAPDKDSWYVVIAGHRTADLSPLYPGRQVMSFTNPIWVDILGDGFTSPGL
ncbi:MAG: CehA/McbA family metallohydrolase [Deltaproteobacteria bacterium]|nr:CehA/McbA family metallohydrolase [Deltaproteobacteria bacterium]